MANIDHLVIAGGDLNTVMEWFADLTGVVAVPGGSHSGVGTRNALASLGGSTYLELIAPDPNQPEPAGPRPFGVDQLSPSDHQLRTFAVAVADIDGALAALRAVDLDLGPAMAMARARPDGVELAWRLSAPAYPGDDGGTIPFLIDWGASQHPSADLPMGCTLGPLTLVHPTPARVDAALAVLELDLRVSDGASAGVEAQLLCPNGVVTVS